MLGNLACSLIQHGRIKTSLAKAKALRPLAEKMVTHGKKGSLHHRRLAMATLGQDDAVKKLFSDIAPRFKERNGGYVRILKLGPRKSDAALMALIEWVDHVTAVEVVETETTASKDVAKESKDVAKKPKAAKKSPKKDE